MSLLLALLLQSSGMETPDGPPTPDRNTESTLKYDCDLADVDRKYHKVIFERRGGRGYWVYSNNPVNNDKKWVAQTPLFIHVLTDETKSLEEFSVLEKADSFLRQHLPYAFRNADGYVETVLEMGRTIVGNQPRYSTATITRTNNSLDTGFTGHCVVADARQLPLTEKETAFYQNRSAENYRSHELEELKMARKAEKLK